MVSNFIGLSVLYFIKCSGPMAVDSAFLYIFVFYFGNVLRYCEQAIVQLRSVSCYCGGGLTSDPRYYIAAECEVDFGSKIQSEARIQWSADIQLTMCKSETICTDYCITNTYWEEPMSICASLIRL